MATVSYGVQKINENAFTSAVCQILGAFERTAILGDILSVLSSLVPVERGAPIDSFYEYLELYEEDGKDPQVTLGIATPSGKKLYDEEDRIVVSAVWKKPYDADEYYTYENGAKVLEIAYVYSVYGGSNPVLSEKSRVITRMYY